jgi:hypothetical protein
MARPLLLPLAFGFDEGRLRQILIVKQVFKPHSFVNDEVTGLSKLSGPVVRLPRWYAKDNCRRQIAGHPLIR